jgi:hypothetical protein
MLPTGRHPSGITRRDASFSDRDIANKSGHSGLSMGIGGTTPTLTVQLKGMRERKLHSSFLQFAIMKIESGRLSPTLEVIPLSESSTWAKLRTCASETGVLSL